MDVDDFEFLKNKSIPQDDVNTGIFTPGVEGLNDSQVLAANRETVNSSPDLPPQQIDHREVSGGVAYPLSG